MRTDRPGAVFNAGHRKLSEMNGVLALNDSGFSHRGDQVNSDGRTEHKARRGQALMPKVGVGF